MRRAYLVFGVFLVGLLVATQALERSLVVRAVSQPLYVGLVALAFLAAGSGLAWWLQGIGQQRTPAPGMRFEAQGQLLSAREKEVLELLAEGLSNQQLADRLHVSLSTVKTHLSNIYSKLGAQRRTDALAKARQLGLLRERAPVPRSEG
ncbi:MAG: response regulator transcription factor [Bacteroidia bacterium]|nr:response regulator transcription factor [Bacteroidia bacterium]